MIEVCNTSNYFMKAFVIKLANTDIAVYRENTQISNRLIRKVLEERFVNLHNLFTSQIMDSPEERYLNMLKNNPGLINRIPQPRLRPCVMPSLQPDGML